MRTPVQPKCWTDSSQRATLLWHRLHRHGVGRGTVVKLASQEDRCRAHLLRHRPRCTAARTARCKAPRRHTTPPTSPLRRPPQPGRPAGRPGWGTLHPTQTRAVPQFLLFGRTSRTSKPTPHRRIEAVPDRRSQRSAVLGADHVLQACWLRCRECRACKAHCWGTSGPTSSTCRSTRNPANVSVAGARGAHDGHGHTRPELIEPVPRARAAVAPTQLGRGRAALERERLLLVALGEADAPGAVEVRGTL